MQATSNGGAAVTTLAGGGISQSLPEPHTNGANEEALSFESNVILRRPKTDQKQIEYRGSHRRLSEFEEKQSPEDPGRMTPESLSEIGFASSRNEEYFDDDGQSSVCSEMIFCCGGGGGGGEDAAGIPTKYSTLDRNFKMRKTESLVEALEKQRRESVGNRLKELHKTTTTTTKRRTSLFAAIDEMPVIAKRSPSGDNNLLLVLPRQTTRRSSYQSVIAGPFLSSAVSQSRLFGSAALDRLERRNSITAGWRVQTPTRFFFPLRETESLSGMEHFVVEPSSEQLPRGIRRLHAPSSPLDADRTLSSEGLSTAAYGVEQSASSGVDRQSQPIETTTRCCCNDEDDDDTVKSDDRRIIVVVANDDGGDSNRFRCADGDPAAATNKETDRRCKEYEEKNDEAEVLSAVPSISNEGSSCEGISSTQYSADIRINGSSSSSSSSPSPSSSSLSSSSSLGTNDGAKHAAGLRVIETPDSVQFHEDDDDKTKVKQPTFSSKAEDPAHVGVCPPAEVARRSSAAAPKADEDAKKASDGDDRIVSKGDTYSQKEKKKYYSDIRIQLKETHSPRSRNYEGREDSSTQNGSLPVAASNESQANDDDDDNNDDGDDDDDDDDGESDAEVAENIVPNWSSYPGPLLNSSPAENSHFEEEAIDIPKRNISTLEINVNYTNNSDSSDRPGDDRPTACRSVQTVSQAPTNTDDQVNGNRIRDSDLSYYSHVYLRRRDAKERSTGAEDPLQASFDFFGNRSNASQTNDCRRGLDGICSTERREVFLVESRSVNARTQALPRDQRSRNPSNTGGGSCDGGFPQRNLSSLASQNGDRRERRTLRGHESILSPTTDAAPTSCSRQEGAGPTTDQLKTRPATAVNGGMSESPVMQLKSSDGQRTEGSFKGSGGGGGGGGSSEQSPLTPSSVERIWESVEEPRPRTLRRKIRFELDSESLPPSAADSRRSRASSDSEPATKDDAAARIRTTMMIRSLSTEENGVRRRNAPVPAEAISGELLDIDVPKGGLGLGFCIEGGKDGPYGDRPITVKRLFRVSSDPKASGASEVTLRPGDELISANGRDMTLLSRYVAWNYLKTLPEGTIKLVIRRRQQ